MKKALEKCYGHEISKLHSIAVHFLLNRNSKVSVISLILKQKIEKQNISSTALLTIISTLQYLCKMGLSLRGHSHNEGNFVSLLEETCQDVPSLKL